MHTRQTLRTIATAAITAALAAGCQSTSQETSTEDTANDYPDLAGSPGLTADTSNLGIPSVSNQQSQQWAAFGAPYLAFEQLIADVNADGGALGYQLAQVALLDGIRGDETTAEDGFRAICDQVVIERPTFASIGYFDSIAMLEQGGCVGPERMINIMRTSLVREADLAETPDVVAPYALDDVTAGRTLVARLNAQGFFDGARKVAVVSPGPLYAETAEDVVAAEVEALGVEDLLVITTEDTTDAVASSVALQLKTADVDRIVWFNDSSTGYRIVASMVEQGFTPQLGTLNAALLESVISRYGYPASQISVVSTLSSYTYGPGGGGDAEFASVPDTPASERCEAALQSTGLKLLAGMSLFLLQGCDVVTLTVAALEASGADEPSTAAFFDGLAELTEFDSAFGVQLDFSHGRAGAAQVWDLKGDDACGCLKVVGGPHPVNRD